jgi:hypothetical protein
MEALCILLRRLAYPNRLADLCFLFPRSPAALSRIHNHVLNDLYDDFGHLLRLKPENFSVGDLTLLGEAVHAVTKSEIDTCIGFIDGTVRSICRPTIDQDVVYNGHRRTHALKYQAFVAPNGLIIDLYGPRAGVDHDARLFHESNLNEKLSLLVRPSHWNDNAIPFCCFGDQAYPATSFVGLPMRGQNLTRGQREFNFRMSQAREAVEWAFKDVSLNWAFIDFKKNQKVGLQSVGKMYIVAALLSNIKNCLEPNQISIKFDLPPPHVKDYLNGYMV